MNRKFYVSFEAEELLIENGYPIEKNAPIYNKYGDIIGCYPADRPTKAEVIDWLESKGIVVEAFYTRHHWFFSIIDFNVKQKIFADEYYPTRLEAEDAAIIKACELL